MARDDGNGEPDTGEPFVADDDLAEHLEGEVSRIASSNRSPLAELSNDELVETLSAEVAAGAGTLDAITKLQAALADRAEEAARGGRHSAARRWIVPEAFLEGPAARSIWDGSQTSSVAPQPVPAEAELVSAPNEAAGSLPAGMADKRETPESSLVPLTTASVPVAVMVGATTESQHPIDAVGDESGRDVDGGDSDVVDDSVLPDDGDQLAPRATLRLAEDARVLEESGEREPIFRIEAAGSEPTPLEFRAARSTRLFWLWFAATSSLATIGLGAALGVAGLAWYQAVIAIVAGLALSAVPLSLGTLAGKWSGQPTMIVSRAVYGVIGNFVPAALAFVTRLFWGAAVVWLLGTTAGRVAVAEGWASSATPVTIVASAIAVLVAGAVAFIGYGLLVRVQVVLALCSAVLIIGTVAATAQHLDPTRLGSLPVGTWTAVLGGTVLVFSYVGLAWASSSSDLARYQRPRSSGAGAMTWASVGAVVAPLVLIAYGALIAMSDRSLGGRLSVDPVGALLTLGLPDWYTVPLALSVVVGLLSALVLNIYSGAFALGAAGLPGRRPAGVVVTVVCVAAASAGLIHLSADFSTVYRSLPLTLAVPVAAWAGTFIVDLMIRRRRFHGESLLKRGGVYPDWRWTNLAALLISSAVGFGLVDGRVSWLGWEGYLLDPLHIPWAGTGEIGVLVSLVIGAAASLGSGVRSIRRQELRSK